MEKFEISKKSIMLYILTLIIIIGGDQITKMIVDQTLQLNAGYSIIENFFYFTYSHNAGAAWGIFQGKMFLFYIISLVAFIGIVYYFLQTKPYQKLTRFGFVLILGGLFGNLIDRVLFNYVRDFIDFIILGYDFPVFNVADMAITIGVALVLIEIGIEEYKIWKISKSQSQS